MANHHASFYVISQLPRFALEAIAFGGMMLLILFLMSQKVSFIDLLPIITLYSLAGYRLMPALQKIYNSFAQLRYARPALNTLYNDVKNLKPFDLHSKQKFLGLELKEKITLNPIHKGFL